MKKLINIAIAAAAVVAMGSCKKFLNQPPLSQGETSNYYKSGKDMNAAIAGVYSALQTQMLGDGTSKYGGNFNYWGEGRADNFERSGYPNTTITELALNGLTTGNSATDWSGLYQVINRANYCIKYFPRIPALDNTVTPTVLANAMAQVYAVRALSYFYIVRLWGDPVVWTDPYEDISQPSARPRTAAATVLDTVVIADLQKAYGLITKNATPNVYNVGEAAIAAMLADAYMWKKDYPNAVTWIGNVFKAKGPTGAVYTGTSGANLEPISTWKNLFVAPYASVESIWSINWDQAYNGCACLPMGIAKSNSPVSVDSLFKATWRVNTKIDQRLVKSIDTLAGNNHDNIVPKFYNIAGNAVPTGTGAPDAQQYNVYPVMYRLGDIYLLYAEALNKLSDPTNALKYLNYVRVRAGLPAYLATDPAVTGTANLENAILDERHFELFGEGKRWFDLVRTDHVKQVLDPILKIRQVRFGSPATGFDPGPNNGKYLWPLHRDVLTANKIISQNKDY